MKWTDAPDDAQVIDLSSPSLAAVTALQITAFRTEREAEELRAGDGAPPQIRLAPLSSRVLTKADLDPLTPSTHSWLRLSLSLNHTPEPGTFGERSLWALIAWSNKSGAFHLVLRSWGMGGFNVGVAMPIVRYVPPLTLFADAPPRNMERVFVIGDGGSAGHDYENQVRTYILMREFADTSKWKATGETFPNLRETAEAPGTPRHHDGDVVTLIENVHARERVSYTRMFPPFDAGPITAQGAKRAWAQWYPISRYTQAADPVDGDRNALTRAYAYLRRVGSDTPGRVREFVVVSHAYVRSPLNLGGAFNHNRPEVDFAGDLGPLLDAFAPQATFWVTGCNVDGGSSQLYHPPDRRLVASHALANVEGATRAYQRLAHGVAAIRAALTMGQELAAQTLAARVFGHDAKHAGVAYWRLPGLREGALRTLEPTFPGRAGDVIASHHEFARRADVLARWGAATRGTTTDEARLALDWIAETITWPWVLERPMHLTVSELRDDGTSSRCDYTVGEWIDNARQVLSAGVHYVAAFAHAARSRPGIRAYGGVPGYDGQHLTVTIEARYSVAGKELATSFTGSGQITAYRRSTRYQASVLPWMILFYRRFGFRTDHPLWYLDYSRDRLTASGEVAANFDHESLDPWPPPWLPR